MSLVNIMNSFLLNTAAVPLQNLCVSSQEFDARKDIHFNNYCPVCLKMGGELVPSKILQQGLVQYKASLTCIVFNKYVVGVTEVLYVYLKGFYYFTKE